MKNIAALIFLFLFNQEVFAQYLIASFIGNDCAKCQTILNGVLNKSDNPPLFFVFPKQYEEDSLEVFNMVSSFKGSVIFSDTYFKMIGSVSSGLAYVNAKGDVSFQKPISNLTNSDRDILDSLYKLESTFKIIRPIFPRTVDGWKITEKSITNSTKIDSGGISLSFKLDSLIVSNCIDAVNKITPGFYKRTEEERVNKTVPEQFLRPVMTGSTIYKGIFYFIVAIPYVEPQSEEDKKNGHKGRIGAQFILVKNEKGSKKYFPILLPSESTSKTYKMTFPARSFRLTSDSTIVLFQYSYEQEKDMNNYNFLAEYKILKDRVIFIKKKENKYPNLYFDKKIDFKLSPSFTAYDYPYYSAEMGTVISDLSTENDYNYIPPYEIYYSKIDSSDFINRLMQGKEKLPVNNIYLFNRVFNKTTCLISIANSICYINIFNKSSDNALKLVKTIDLSRRLTDIADYPYIEYDKKNDILKIEGKSNIVHSLPLNLLIE